MDDVTLYELVDEAGITEGPFSLDQFLADNADWPYDETEVAEMRALMPGQEMNLGGGAAPVFTLRRLA